MKQPAEQFLQHRRVVLEQPGDLFRVGFETVRILARLVE